MLWAMAPLCSASAFAQDAATFYKAHTLTIGSPNSPGGGYDIYIRALARHIAKHIPGNPSIIVQNVRQPEAWCWPTRSTAPKDGSYFGMVRGTAIQEEVYKAPAWTDATASSKIFGTQGDNQCCRNTIMRAASRGRTISALP
jgi:hypothetical protein